MPDTVIWKFVAREGADGLAWVTDWSEGARILTADYHPRDGVQIWAQADPSARRGAKLFHLRGTGMTVDANAEYVCTFKQPGGPNNGRWIWHLYHFPGTTPMETPNA